MRNKQSRKVNIPFTIAVVLLCLLTFSVYLTSGMLARYTTRASFSDSARVAKFTVGATSSITNMKFDYRGGAFKAVDEQGGVIVVNNVEQTVHPYSLTVTNNSEVAVRYNVELIPEAGSFANITVSAMVGETALTVTVTDGKAVINGGELAAGSTSEVMTINFSVADSYLNTLTPTTNTLVATDTAIDFDALVRIVQID